jgi:hypothetical protein
MTTDPAPLPEPGPRGSSWTWVWIVVALFVAGGFFYWALWDAGSWGSPRAPGAPTANYNNNPPSQTNGTPPVSNNNAVQTPPNSKAEANGR